MWKINLFSSESRGSDNLYNCQFYSYYNIYYTYTLSALNTLIIIMNRRCATRISDRVQNYENTILYYTETSAADQLLPTRARADVW